MTSENTKDDYCMILSSVCEVGRGCDILELVSDWLTSCFKKETKEGPTNAKVYSFVIYNCFAQHF